MCVVASFARYPSAKDVNRRTQLIRNAKDWVGGFQLENQLCKSTNATTFWQPSTFRRIDKCPDSVLSHRQDSPRIRTTRPSRDTYTDKAHLFVLYIRNKFFYEFSLPGYYWIYIQFFKIGRWYGWCAVSFATQGLVLALNWRTVGDWSLDTWQHTPNVGRSTEPWLRSKSEYCSLKGFGVLDLIGGKVSGVWINWSEYGTLVAQQKRALLA